jgi:hypothetical protein
LALSISDPLVVKAPPLANISGIWLFQAMIFQLIFVPPFTLGSLPGRGTMAALPCREASGASGSITRPISALAFASCGRLSHQKIFPA